MDDLVHALRANNNAELKKVFGPGGEDILSSGDPVSALSGKTITGKRVNADSALNYLLGQQLPTGSVLTLNNDIVSGWDAAGSPPAIVAETAPPSAPVGAANLLSTRAAAGLGEAKAVGALSVPPTWAAATPAVRPIALALPAAPAGFAPQAMAPGLEGSFGEMALAGTAGRAITSSITVYCVGITSCFPHRDPKSVILPLPPSRPPGADCWPPDDGCAV